MLVGVTVPSAAQATERRSSEHATLQRTICAADGYSEHKSEQGPGDQEVYAFGTNRTVLHV